MEPAEIAENFFKRRQRAELLIEIGRYRDALGELNAHLALYPDDYYSLCQTAFCHYELGEHQSAYDVTKKAVSEAPEEEWAYRLQSLIFAASGDKRRALEAAEKSVKCAPDFVYALHALVNAQIGTWKLDDAEKTAARMFEVAPDHAVTYDAAGFVALNNEDYQKAEEHYLEALKLDPESVSALNNLGVVYMEYVNAGKGKHYRKKSAEMFERAVRAQPTFVRGQENLKIANTAAKAGIPIAAICLACWLTSTLANLGRHSAGLAPDIFQSLTLLSPYNHNYLLFGLNLLSLVMLVAMTAFAIKYYFSKDRERLIRPFRRTGPWVLTALGTLIPFVFYIIFLTFLDIEASAFSYLALILLFAACFYAFLQAILRFELRKTE